MENRGVNVSKEMREDGWVVSQFQVSLRPNRRKQRKLRGIFLRLLCFLLLISNRDSADDWTVLFRRRNPSIIQWITRKCLLAEDQKECPSVAEFWFCRALLNMGPR